jgi:hypothetical protein
MTAPLGLAALTVLDTPPLQHVDLAERHGFDTIGLRLLPAAPGTTAYPLHEDPAALDTLVRRLANSPIEVFDLEIIRIAEEFDVASYRPLLETGARLGARAVLVGGDDPDRGRLTDSYAQLAQLCAEYGTASSRVSNSCRGQRFPTRRLLSRSFHRPTGRHAAFSSTRYMWDGRARPSTISPRFPENGCTMRKCAMAPILFRTTTPN